MTTHYREIHWIWNKRKCVDKCARLPVISWTNEWNFLERKKSGCVKSDVDACARGWMDYFRKDRAIFQNFTYYAYEEDPRSSTIEEQYESSSRRNKNRPLPFSGIVQILATDRYRIVGPIVELLTRDIVNSLTIIQHGISLKRFASTPRSFLPRTAVQEISCDVYERVRIRSLVILGAERGGRQWESERE